MTTPPRDPDCTCGWSPEWGRIWCTNCLVTGPLARALTDTAPESQH